MIRKKTKTGIFGGSFNPIHLGHVETAKRAYDAADLDSVIFVPAGSAPHKSALTDAPHRVRMCELALARTDLPFYVSDIEAKKSTVSYSVDTVTAFSNDRTELFFIIGDDAYKELYTWKDVRRLRTLCRFIVVSREGGAVVGGNDIHIILPAVKLSSTDIRKGISRGDYSGLSDEVTDYIIYNKLYCEVADDY